MTTDERNALETAARAATPAATPGLGAILQTHSPTISEDGWEDQMCEACDTDWPCPRWDETFTPGAIGELLAENAALREGLGIIARSLGNIARSLGIGGTE
jgi:hypothetical protein